MVKLSHLLRTFEVEEVARHLDSFLIIDGSIGADAEEQVVGRGVFRVKVVDIVGGDERDTRLVADGD